MLDNFHDLTQIHRIQISRWSDPNQVIDSLLLLQQSKPVRSSLLRLFDDSLNFSGMLSRMFSNLSHFNRAGLLLEGQDWAAFRGIALSLKWIWTFRSVSIEPTSDWIVVLVHTKVLRNSVNEPLLGLDGRLSLWTLVSSFDCINFDDISNVLISRILTFSTRVILMTYCIFNWNGEIEGSHFVHVLYIEFFFTE